MVFVFVDLGLRELALFLGSLDLVDHHLSMRVEHAILRCDGPQIRPQIIDLLQYELTVARASMIGIMS